MNIEQEVNQLIALTDTMNECIAEEQYIEFSEQQEFFAARMKQVMDTANEDELLSVLEQLKKIQKILVQIQLNATTLQTKLKKKSLAIKRGKKVINAYK